MRDQDFELIRERLLPLVERIVVQDHAALFRDTLQRPWSPPDAYRWIRYEGPDPISRLIDATRRLDEEWTRTGQNNPMEELTLEEALTVARNLGYPD